MVRAARLSRLTLRRPAAAAQAVAWVFAALGVAACGPSRQELAAEQRATLERYCFECHDDAGREADLSLESLDVEAVGTDAAVWEHVVRKLSAGMMPPHDGGPRPTAEETAGVLSWLEGELDRAAAESPNPGRTVPFHRLNRNEYRNAVRDLLAVDVDVASMLPGDDASYGFDNIGGVLKLSPTLLERYLSAADKISRLAVGTASPFVNFDTYRIPDDRSQERRLPGMPFGTRGGILIDYTFPQDGEYEFSAALARDLNEGMPIYTEPQVLEVSIDRERVATFTLDAATLLPAGPNADGDDFGGRMNGRVAREEQQARNRADEDWTVRVPVMAGQREVAIAFLDKAASIPNGKREPFLRPFPRGLNIPEGRYGSYLRRVEISGPYDATGPGQTASRERIFSCRPATDERAATPDAEACAETILASLARRAYRRPVAEGELAPLLEFYRAGHGDSGSFDGGVQVALKALLVSPEFLFRIQRDPADAAPGSLYRISDLELASRLSFFLWSSIPDDELLAAAERGTLGKPRELERQVRRMIADPRADAFVGNFAGQWLYLRNLEAVIPVQSIFPNFDDTLREGLRQETELFFASVLREDRNVLDLLDADYTFVNERVARHYGIPNVKGSHFRRVQLPEGSPRRGLLGHGSVLAVTSRADRTSPVVRGQWILENLLGAEPPPPANVPPLDATNTTDGQGTVLSLRERLTAHRANPTCASCHMAMDSLGFALEGFDAVGRWRAIDELGDPIDASGVLPDGSTFRSFDEFRETLKSSELFRLVLAEKLMTYALGRGVEPYDMPAVRAIVRDAADDDNRFSQFILGVVNSTPFRMRRTAL
jgi:hypothetical protein